MGDIISILIKFKFGVFVLYFDFVDSGNPKSFIG